MIRISGHNISETLASVREEWSDILPDSPMNYSFLDDDFSRLFEQEQKLGKAVSLFATLAIFIACLGLFSLAAFTAERRSKEIGIRKVLGASAEHILALITGRFLLLATVGAAVALPLGYYLIHNWLDNYAYRIEVGIGLFAGAAAIVVAVIVVSVGGLAIRASLLNPVETLRSD